MEDPVRFRNIIDIPPEAGQEYRVTRRKDNAAAMEKTFRAVFEQSSLPGGILDADGTVLNVNAAACRLIGIESAEVAGKPVWEIRRWTRNAGEKKKLREGIRAAARGESVGFKVVHREPGSGARAMEYLIKPLRDCGGGVFCLLCEVRDITKERRGADERREKESMLRGVFNAAPIGVTFTVSRVIIRMNKSMCSLLGYEEGEIVGRNARMFYDSDDEYERVGRELYGKANRGVSTGVETRFVRKDSSIINVILSSAWLKPGNPSAGFIVTVQDITERVRAEREEHGLREQLQQAMKMEAVGRLAGGIAHDFNNLLTTIAGSAQLAAMELPPDGEAAQYLKDIREATGSAAALTRQLLAFSRRQIIEPRVLNLNDLIGRIQKMLMRVIGEDIGLETVRGEALWSVRVDPGQFEQALVNLAVNARDAMPDGGKLVIETANRELGPEFSAAHPHVRPGRYVMTAVRDTGHGMTEEVKRRIFEPFFTTKPTGRGTGLGLATIFGIVRQAEGAIEIESEVGAGTTFRIFLPRTDDSPEELDAERPSEDLEGGAETILVVEDEGSVRSLATNVLEKLGYRVLQADGGARALELARGWGERIDLLMTDVVMKGMSGRELAETLCSSRAEMKVLFTSGYTEDVIVRHGVMNHSLNFISKPYTLEALSRKIREVLGKGR